MMHNSITDLISERGFRVTIMIMFEVYGYQMFMEIGMYDAGAQWKNIGHR